MKVKLNQVGINKSKKYYKTLINWLMLRAETLQIYIWVEPARKGKGQTIGNITLYVLGSLDHLYIFCFTGNCHVFEAYRGKSYYGI